jgi:hypothetical protein
VFLEEVNETTIWRVGLLGLCGRYSARSFDGLDCEVSLMERNQHVAEPFRDLVNSVFPVLPAEPATGVRVCTPISAGRTVGSIPATGANFLSAPMSAAASFAGLLPPVGERSGADEEKIPRCECDYDAQGDPLKYVKVSHYCPQHDECECCGERLGTMKDPSFPNGYDLARIKRAMWICQQCADETCPKCGFDLQGGCKCAEAELDARTCAFCGQLDCAVCERDFARGFDEAKGMAAHG